MATSPPTFTVEVTYPDTKIHKFGFEKEQTLHQVKTTVFAKYHADHPQENQPALSLSITGEPLKNNFTAFADCHPFVIAAIALGENPSVNLEIIEPLNASRRTNVLSKIAELLSFAEKFTDTTANASTTAAQEPKPATPSILSTDVDNNVLDSFDSLLDVIQLEPEPEESTKPTSAETSLKPMALDFKNNRRSVVIKSADPSRVISTANLPTLSAYIASVLPKSSEAPRGASITTAPSPERKSLPPVADSSPSSRPTSGKAPAVVSPRNFTLELEDAISELSLPAQGNVRRPSQAAAEASALKTTDAIKAEAEAAAARALSTQLAATPFQSTPPPVGTPTTAAAEVPNGHATPPAAAPAELTKKPSSSSLTDDLEAAMMEITHPPANVRSSRATRGSIRPQDIAQFSAYVDKPAQPAATPAASAPATTATPAAQTAPVDTNASGSAKEDSLSGRRRTQAFRSTMVKPLLPLSSPANELEPSPTTLPAVTTSPTPAPVTTPTDDAANKADYSKSRRSMAVPADVVANINAAVTPTEPVAEASPAAATTPTSSEQTRPDSLGAIGKSTSNPKSLVTKPSNLALRNTVQFAKTAKNITPLSSEDEGGSSDTTTDSSSDDDEMPVNEETILLGGAGEDTSKRPSRDRFSTTSSPKSSTTSSDAVNSPSRSKRKFRRAKKRTFDSGDSAKQRRGTNILDDDDDSRSTAQLMPLETGTPWMIAKPVVFDDSPDVRFGRAKFSVQRMSLMQQAAFFEMLPDDLMNYRLAHDLAASSSTIMSILHREPIEILIHLRGATPEAPSGTVKISGDGKETIKVIKERAYNALQELNLSAPLKPVTDYILEFSDSDIFLLEEDATLFRLSVSGMEQFDMHERTVFDVKRKFYIGISELIHVAGLTMHWAAGQTEQMHFRKVTTRNTCTLTKTTVQASKITYAPMPPYMPSQIAVTLYLKETLSKGMIVSPTQTVSQLITEFTKKIPSPEVAVQLEDPSQWMLRLAGCAEFVIDDVQLHMLEYVRKCLERRKKVQFILTRRPADLPKPKALAPAVAEVPRGSSSDDFITARTKSVSTSNPSVQGASQTALNKSPSSPSIAAEKTPLAPRVKPTYLAETDPAAFKEDWLTSRPRDRAFALKSAYRRRELYSWTRRANTMPLYLIKKALEIKVDKVDLLMVASANFHPQTKMFMEVGLFYGGEPICHAKRTKLVPFGSSPVFDQILSFKSMRICNMPRETRICITLFAKDPKNNETPIGWVAFSLFDFHDLMKSGQLEAWMWPNDRANPIGVCGSCPEMKLKNFNKLTLQLDRHYAPILFTRASDLPQLAQNPNVRTASEKPPSNMASEINALVVKDPLWKPSDDEKMLLWKYRYYVLQKYPEGLSKVALSVPWTNPIAVHQFYSLLDEWPRIPIELALELLDSRYPDSQLRSYAVECLDNMPDEQLESYLLQLIQVLKYEPHHSSPLAQFLVDRALQNETGVGVPLFWYLKAELHIPEITERFSLILEAFVSSCTASFRSEITKQVAVIETFTDLANFLKNIPQNKRTDVLREKLDSGITFPDTFTLPLNPTLQISGTIDISKCRCFDSAKAPLLLCFKSADPITSMEDSFIIFKAGDDLRQDALTLQMLNLMDQIWKASGLDLHLTPYHVSVTGDNSGLIEVVPDSTTTAKIQKEAGGVTAAFKETPLANWVRSANPKDDEYAKAVDNFALSCAGYCVATYVLGIGDRHNDNIMIDKHGHLFHIDFGHFLGNFKSWKGIWNREKAPFVLTPEFAFVMGGKDGEKFKYFSRLCCRAFNFVRKHANLFMNLFIMMLSTGIPELRSEEDLLYLHDALCPDLSDDDASEQFQQLIMESLGSKTTQINFAFHIFAH